MTSLKPHLLLFGWYRPGTGFTRVLEALIPTFAQEFRITWMAVGYQGDAFVWAPDVLVRPTNLRGGDMVGAYAARLEWAQLQPDLVFALNDVWYLVHYSRELAAIRGSVPMVGYLPLDGLIPNAELLSELTGFSALVTYTQSAALELETALRTVHINTPVLRAGHGIDLDHFHPLIDLNADWRAQRMALAQIYFGLDQPTFVVLNASRPDPRKRIDLTLQAFARFAQSRADSLRLCLHQAISHNTFVDPLRAQAKALGIADKVIWHPREAGPITDEALNRTYNACALGINTAHGEGFGLVSFEHAATGVPQIVPGQEALRELWGDSAWCLSTRAVMTPHSPLLMGEVDVHDVAAALATLHDQPLRYAELAQAAWQRTQQADLRWSAVSESLLRICLAQVRQSAE